MPIAYNVIYDVLKIYSMLKRGGVTMIQKNSAHLQPGDVLGQDLFRHTTLILNKGTVLTEHHISRIHQWGFDMINIKDEDAEKKQASLEDVEKTVVSDETAEK